MRKVKKPTITKLKKTLWKLIRESIISKYGRTCYTCGATNLLAGNCQIGHFITRSICSMEMAFSEDNLRPQCFACNIWKSGNWLAYEKHLKRDGVDVEELKLRNERTMGEKHGIDWVERRIAEYGKNVVECK